jgi:RNA polymerase sigma factor (sigma-70 family)
MPHGRAATLDGLTERPDDRALLEAWRDGDRRAGRRLVERHLAGLGRFFANKVGHEQEAQDLVAETFERFSQALPRYRGDSSVRTFLYAIAHNVLREHFRRRERETGRAEPLESVADLGPSPSMVVAQHQQQRLLLHALRALPLEHQIVLELSLFEDMSRAEIAEITGTPAGTIAGRLRRARELLDERLAALCDSPALLESTTTDLAQWAQSLRDALLGAG